MTVKIQTLEEMWKEFRDKLPPEQKELVDWSHDATAHNGTMAILLHGWMAAYATNHPDCKYWDALRDAKDNLSNVVDVTAEYDAEIKNGGNA